MSLVSLAFFCFLGAIFAVYYGLACSNVLQKWVLLVAGYVFYAFLDYRFCTIHHQRGDVRSLLQVYACDGNAELARRL